MAPRQNPARIIREERAQERESLEARSRDANAERRARVSAMAGMLSNSALPNYPVNMIAGFRLFWGVVNNLRDPVEARLKAGYSIVQREEIPELYRDSSAIGEKATNGQYGNAVVCAEHILLKIPTELWEDYMWYTHHDEPYSFFEDTIAQAQDRAEASKSRITIEEGMQQEADKRYLNPTFS